MLIDILLIVLALGLFFIAVRSILLETPLALEESELARESKESAARLARNAAIVEILIGLLCIALVVLKAMGILADDLVTIVFVIILFELYSTRWLVLYMMKPKKK